MRFQDFTITGNGLDPTKRFSTIAGAFDVLLFDDR